MNSNDTWLSAIFLLLFACFICLLGLMITGCNTAYGEEPTAHDADADKHHTHFTKPHAHVHGSIYTYPTLAGMPQEASSDRDTTAGDIALGILVIVALYGLGFFLGYHYGRIGR